jgi:hypothetical protein
MKLDKDTLDLLGSCRVEGNTLYLPDRQLDRTLYTKVNKCLESIGGKWDKKAKGHVFDSDPTELLNVIINTGEVVDIKKEYQFFPTPAEIAQKMIEWADIRPDDIVLEPSAGQGAIADLIPYKDKLFLCELNAQNAAVLRGKGYQVHEGDFLRTEFLDVTKVVMNPPFSKQQDIDHVLHA